MDFVGGVPDNCGGVTPVAFVNINEFNDELLAIAATYAKPNQVPISLADDVAIYVGPNTNNCCVLGYHNAVPVAGGTQLYAVGAYFTISANLDWALAMITTLSLAVICVSIVVVTVRPRV